MEGSTAWMTGCSDSPSKAKGHGQLLADLEEDEAAEREVDVSPGTRGGSVQDGCYEEAESGQGHRLEGGPGEGEKEGDEEGDSGEEGELALALGEAFAQGDRGVDQHLSGDYEEDKVDRGLGSSCRRLPGARRREARQRGSRGRSQRRVARGLSRDWVKRSLNEWICLGSGGWRERSSRCR